MSANFQMQALITLMLVNKMHKLCYLNAQASGIFFP